MRRNTHPARPRAAAIAVAIAAGLGGVATAQAADMARVVSSTPVIASIPVASQSCSDGQQIVQTPPSGAGALIGAIAGGVLGNSVGGGFGRAAATGVGVVAGSIVGNQVEAANTPATALPVRNCQNFTRYENRTVGYDVVYEYAGQRYSTRMTRDPGQRFAVSVQPADGGLPAPVDAGPPAYAQQAAPVPAYAAAPVYAPAETAYYAPAPVYAAPYYAPYYAPAPYFYGPPIGIGIGFGFYGGHRGGRWR
ncbi:MAG TPA: glycine zipper 2TM domain-containing protein [Burkholderiaceae bacterium]|jgi:uncharacterized protein YcfJ